LIKLSQTIIEDWFFWDMDLRCFSCQVATVVMETTQLVLSQFKNFLRSQLWIEWSLSPKNK